MSKNIPALKAYGIKLIERFKLDELRIQFEYDFELTEENIISFLKSKKIFDSDTNQIEIATKKFVTNDNLKFHIDDCQLVKLKIPPTYNVDQYIHLEDNKYLYFNNKFKVLPKFTAIFYSSTHGIDFDGGILTFADEKQIIPKAKSGIIFDSREAHMVMSIKSGTRTSTIVKIY